MKLMILDGNSIINRAYYGVRPLTTRDGQYTHAIFGFLNILEKLRQEENPDALCVAFDLPGKTFRHIRYDQYKATRHGMPDELAQQMPVMKQVLSAMNIPMYACEGWEADDVVGTVGRICGESGWDCVIVTGDRDDLQLIDGHVAIKYVSTKGGKTTTTRYDTAQFEAEYGFPPARLVDFKALMGDSSDNIPGVPGVGQKTATDLLQRFGSLESLYAHLDEVKESVRKKLVAGRDLAALSYELATIQKDAPIVFRPEDNLVQEPDRQALYELFLKLEFLKLIDRYGLRDAPRTGTNTPEAVVRQRMDALPPVGTPCAVAFDAEMTKIAVATEAGVCCVPVDTHRLQVEQLLADGTPKACHDLRPLLGKLMQQQITAGGFCFDTALAGYLLNPSEGSYSLQKLSVAYLGQSPEPGLAEEAAAVFALHKTLAPLLAEQGMQQLYEQVELPLCRVLAEMTRLGVAVDRPALEAFGKMLSERILVVERQIYALAGQQFNINSPKQLGEILFEQLQLPSGKKTKTGWSTSAEVLERLKHWHPIIPQILEYRMLTKLNSTYAEGLLKVIAGDGRIHTTFQNTVTATGRLSSTDPNLQNIPVRTALGSELRKMFVARPGWVLVDADYSQIELRVLAHIADDEIMQKAFIDGEDIHRVTASQVFGIPPEQVTAEMRRHAKAVNFGIVYGISEFSLAEDIGVTRAEAKAYIQSYLNKYHGVRNYMHAIVEQARRDGYVTTLMGRRRYLPELKSSNYNIRSGAERIALNTPIQGTAADIIKVAMVRVQKVLADQALQAKLVLQIHDELIVECPEQEAEQVQRIVREQMEQVIQLRVPLVAEAKAGRTWHEAK
ncbi:MAG: DNA polymerase I [Clostridiales bacterium]|nr:DNA polymerase I [Clostridiales bacterium]